MSNDQPAATDAAFAEIKFFSPGSRVNRLRYWAHSMLVAIPFYIVLGISAFLANKISPFFWGLAVIAYIGLIAFSFIIMIQRLHDLNKSGWLSLLALVPLANLYLVILLIFFAGTPGRNDYGLPTPPNKTWHWILALVGPVVVFIGIGAAVAVPAYQQYVQRMHDQSIESATDMDAMDESTDELAPADEEAIEGAEAEGAEASENSDEVDTTEAAEDTLDETPVVDEKTEESTTSEASELPKAPL